MRACCWRLRKSSRWHAGTIKVGSKPIELTTDYIVAHAILGVQHLRTCTVVAVVTSAEEVAVVNGASVHKVKTTELLSANGKPPTDSGDARYEAVCLVSDMLGVHGFRMFFGTVDVARPAHCSQ